MGCSVSATEIANQIVHCKDCEILRQPRYVDNPRVGRKYEILSGKIDRLIDRLDQGEMISIDLSKRLLGRIDKIIENCLNPYWVDRLVCQKERLNPTNRMTWVRSDSGMQFFAQRLCNPANGSFFKTLLVIGLLTGSMVAAAESTRLDVCYSNHSLRPIRDMADGSVQVCHGTRMDQCCEIDIHPENRRMKMCPSHLDQLPHERKKSFLDAIERNEWDKFNQTLDEGPVEGKLADSAVIKAIECNRPEMINRLLDECLISNWCREEILVYAINENRLELFSKVLNAGSISEDTWAVAFDEAIGNNRPEMQNRLLDTGPISLLGYGATFRENHLRAIVYAIDNDRPEILIQGIDAGPVTEELQRSIILYAIRMDRPEVLYKLPNVLHKFLGELIYHDDTAKTLPKWIDDTAKTLPKWIDGFLNAGPISENSRFEVLKWAIKNNQMEYFNRMLEAGPFPAYFISPFFHLATLTAEFKRTVMLSRLGTMFVDARGVAVSYAVENNLPDLFNQMLDNGPISRDRLRALIKVAKDRPEMLNRLLKIDFQYTIRKVVVAAGCLIGVGVAIFINEAVLR